MTGDLNCRSLNVLNDEGWVMLRGILGLLFMRIIGGRILNWLIFSTPYIICLPIVIKLLTLFVCISGGLGGYFISLIILYCIYMSFFFYFLSVFLGSI